MIIVFTPVANNVCIQDTEYKSGINSDELNRSRVLVKILIYLPLSPMMSSLNKWS